MTQAAEHLAAVDRRGCRAGARLVDRRHAFGRPGRRRQPRAVPRARQAGPAVRRRTTRVLMASDVIFTESLGALTKAAEQIAGGRENRAGGRRPTSDGLQKRVSSTRRRARRRLLLLVVLLLVPGARAGRRRADGDAGAHRVGAAPDDAERDAEAESRDRSRSPTRNRARGCCCRGSRSIRRPPSQRLLRRRPSRDRAPEPVARGWTSTRRHASAAISRECSTRATFRALLARAAGVLNARGVIVWVADRQGASLYPMFTHGYPAAVLHRLGSISTDANNATAASWRSGELTAVAGDADVARRAGHADRHRRWLRRRAGRRDRRRPRDARRRAGAGHDLLRATGNRRDAGRRSQPGRIWSIGSPRKRPDPSRLRRN